MTKIIVLIVAAGKGVRTGGDIPKQYVPLAGRTVLARTVDVFMDHPQTGAIATVISPDDIDLYRAATMNFGDRLLSPVSGGQTRQESVCNGLKALEDEAPDFVLIHDAARPFMDEALVTRVIDGLASHEAVLPVIPVADTIKQVSNNSRVTRTVDRSDLYGAQTPQGFRFSVILDLHRKAEATGNTQFTDDVSIAEAAGLDVLCVKGSTLNQKLTTRRDMQMAELDLAHGLIRETRTGSGFDVHRFEPGDGVTLCGVKIPFDKCLKGHSDADVAMHALCDALYGALGAGDIGTHFPPSDAKWKDFASETFLEHAAGLVRKRGGLIVNIDITIICEEPKISPYQAEMRAELARITGIDAHRISIKATTTEQLGFTGRKEGIAAQALTSISLPVGTGS